MKICKFKFLTKIPSKTTWFACQRSNQPNYLALCWGSVYCGNIFAPGFQSETINPVTASARDHTQWYNLLSESRGNFFWEFLFTSRKLVQQIWKNKKRWKMKLLFTNPFGIWISIWLVLWVVSHAKVIFHALDLWFICRLPTLTIWTHSIQLIWGDKWREWQSSIWWYKIIQN